MISYLLQRLLWFVPVLLLISLLAFALSKSAPGDPVEMLNSSGSAPMASNPAQADRLYAETAGLMGLDKPTFYFAITSAAYPDTLHHILRQDRRRVLHHLIGQYGNWPLIEVYYNSIQRAERSMSGASSPLAGPLRDLYLQHKHSAIRARLDTMQAMLQRDSLVMTRWGGSIAELQKNYDAVVSRPDRGRLYQPDFDWKGLDNQYHNWLVGMLKGDFGISYQDGRLVRNKIRDGLRWTLWLNIIAVLLSFGMAIPIGVWSAQRVGGRFDRITSVLLFMLYSLPVLWIATLLQVFFTTPEYGMDLFPTAGLSELPSSAPFFERLLDQAAHVFLPVLCLTYGSLAFISRQMRGGMLQVLDQDYIRTARAKGLSERVVIWRHAFRNALFPIITLIGAVFPSILAGSVVIEVIFGIPGMGKLTVDAIFARDWPVVFAVLMMASVLTVAGLLVSDILYAWADPRVRFQKVKK